MRILVADDEAASAHSLAELLTLIGHQVVGPARDGAEAVRLAATEKPDLAIFDVEMPHMSGLEAIDRITRSRPIPVIVLTGHDCPEFVDRAAQLPVFNYLSKPAGADRLVPAIRLASARFLEWEALHGQVSALSQKMDERKLVERAKGILMELRGLGEAEAYRLMQREPAPRQEHGRGGPHRDRHAGRGAPRGSPRARGARRLTRARSTHPRRRLELIPAGGVAIPFLDTLGAGLDALLGTVHHVGPPLAAPADPGDARLSSHLLDAVIARADAGNSSPDEAWMLAVSGEELRAPGHGRVFGEAAVGAGCAVVGLGPLDGGSRCSAATLLQRAVKVCAHELGHAAGLEHCADRGCVMHPSRDIAGVDRKDKHFCRRCAADLKHATLDAARS